MPHSHVDKNKKYSLEKDLKPYTNLPSRWHYDPLLLLPNLEKVPVNDALNRIAHMPTPTLHCALLCPDDPPGGTAWGSIWLNTLQSGDWDGTGLVVIPGLGSRPPYCANFFLCKHELQYSPSAKPERGLHDQFCILCGLDMSVDSSD